MEAIGYVTNSVPILSIINKCTREIADLQLVWRNKPLQYKGALHQAAALTGHEEDFDQLVANIRGACEPDQDIEKSLTDMVTRLQFAFADLLRQPQVAGTSTKQVIPPAPMPDLQTHAECSLAREES